jgi:hypothetical protein
MPTTEPPPGRVAARMVAVAALVYLALSVASQGLIQIGGLEPSFAGSAEEVTAFFETRDPLLFEVGTYLQGLALLAFLWFVGGLWALLRELEERPAWRSAVVLASGLVFVARLSGGWELAMHRLDEGLDPDIALLAFDLGNLGFANAWLPLGSMLIATALVIGRSGALPRWLGWSAGVVGVGLIAARAVWTSPVAFAPWVAYWAWLVALSVVLLRRVRLFDTLEAADPLGP